MSECLWMNGKTIPPIPCLPISAATKLTQDELQSETHPCSLQLSSVGTNSLSKSLLQGAFNFTDPDVHAFPMFDPKLVFLCYRGYNHCSGKLSSRSFKN